MKSPSFENVFVLSSGRCGSTTFAKALKSVRNYTSAHESRAKLWGPDRLDYPEYHIEVDNRLSFRLGPLLTKYPDAYYVHLLRDENRTARSVRIRWRLGIFRWWWRDLLLQDSYAHNCPKELRTSVARDYVQTANANIQFALRDADHMTIRIERPEKAFRRFCKRINADVDMDEALRVLNLQFNAAYKNRRYRRADEQLTILQ